MSFDVGGSISGVPKFPDISAYTWDMINAELSTTDPSLLTTYEAAKSAFDSANILASHKGDVLLEKRTALQEILADPNATQQEIQQAQDDYEAAFIDFKNTLVSFNDDANKLVLKSDAVFAAATEYVSALARQQMMTAKDLDVTTAGAVAALAALLATDPTITPDANTPAWLLTAITAAAPEASVEERQAIIDAFNQYRLLEYNIAVKRQDFIHNYVEHLKAYYAYLASDPPDPALKDIADQFFVAASVAYSQTTSLIAQRASVLATLDLATTSLGGALRSAFEYLTSDTALKDHLMEKFGAIFVEGYSDKVAADTAAVAAEYTEFPSVNPSYVEEKISPLVSSLEGARASAMPKSIGFPVLPPVTASLSMSDLMRIISKVQLMIQELARYVAEADTSIGSFNVASLLLELAVEKARYEAQKEWIAIVNQADLDYNTQVNEDNKAAADESDATLQYMLQNGTEIESLISGINSDITAWNTFKNASGADLGSACKDVDASLIDAINADRSTKPEAPNYLDFFNFDLDIVKPMDLSALGSVSFGDISQVEDPLSDINNIHDLLGAYKQIVDDPNLLKDSTFCSAHNIPLGSTVEGVVSLINTQLEALLEKMSPALDQIKALLQANWPTQPPPDFDLRKLFMRELIPTRTDFPVYTETFLTQFATAILKIMRMSDIAEEERISMNQFLAGVIKVFRERSAERERQETTSPGVSFGLEAAQIGEAVTNVSKFVSRLAQTDVLALTLSRTIEAAAILSGLVAAGGGVSGLGSSMGISAAELFGELGVDKTQFLTQQSTQSLMLSFAEQLALFAGKTPSLKQNALNVLSQVVGGGNLTQKDVQDILAFLVMFQQLLLLFMSLLMASLGGMSSSRFLTQVLGSAGGSAASMLSAFQALGLSQEKAIALGVALGGTATDLQNLLRSLGLDKGASSIILALIAAQKGKVSLTEGVMGGPAYLDAMIQQLKNAGITITARIGTDEFMRQLVLALEARANAQQLDSLHAELKRIEEANVAKVTTGVSLSNLYEDLLKGINADIAKARAEGFPPAPAALSPIIRPSEILAQYVNEFKRLPQTVQTELLNLAKTNLGGVTGLSDEQKAGLMIGVRLGRATLTEAMTLAEMARRESTGTLSYSDMETSIISKLFKESPEAQLAREEALKRAILDERVRMKELLPSALPQRIVENIRDSVLRVTENFENKQLALRVTERFVKFAEKLSDMTKVGVILLDPGRIPMLLFSPRLGTLPQGKGGAQAPPSILGV